VRALRNNRPPISGLEAVAGHPRDLGLLGGQLMIAGGDARASPRPALPAQGGDVSRDIAMPTGRWRTCPLSPTTDVKDVGKIGDWRLG
jgi:hypothetical protein